MHIGLLEDNSAIIEYMKTALEMAGHTVSIHTHGISLLETLFARHYLQAPLPYDLLIVDIRLMGNMSGLDVVSHIHNTLPAGTLPIIIVSAASKSELESVRQNFPGVPVISKPFKLHNLLQEIESQNPSPNHSSMVPVS